MVRNRGAAGVVGRGVALSERNIQLSVLDRSVLRRGQDAARTLRDTVEFARQAEDLGIKRFWVSEHHSVPGIAGSAPTVLAAAIAAATSRIRVGTGGVMLPNHAPLVVAEQFGVLASLFGDRIDMGLGRSVGFTAAVRAALSADKAETERFEKQLGELMGYLSGEQSVHPGVHARPGEGLGIPGFVLATGSGGAGIAARQGLPLVIAPIRGRDQLLTVIDEYRRDFKPSAQTEDPYVMVAISVAVADTTAQAYELLLPEAWSTAVSRTRGEFPPLWPIKSVRSAEMSERQSQYLRQATDSAIYGTESEVDTSLDALIGGTGADEILLTTNSFDRAQVLGSHRRLARLAGLVTPD